MAASHAHPGVAPHAAEDAANVRAFIEAYCATHARAMARAKQLALTDALTDADRPARSALRQGDLRRAVVPLRRGRRARWGSCARITHSRSARLSGELPRAPAPRVAARGHRCHRRVRAGVRDLPPAPCAHGRTHHRAAHRDGGLVRGRLPRLDRAQVPHVPRRLGRPDAARPESGAAGAREPGFYGFAGDERARGISLHEEVDVIAQATTRTNARTAPGRPSRQRRPQVPADDPPATITPPGRQATASASTNSTTATPLTTRPGSS